MGRGNMDVTTSVFPVNRTTLKGWLTKKELISRWLPIVEKLNGSSVRRAIPMEHVDNYNAPDARYSRTHMSLFKYKKRIQDDKQMRFAIVKSGHNTRMDIVSAKTNKKLLVKRESRRVRTVRGPRSYLEVRESIEEEVKKIGWKDSQLLVRVSTNLRLRYTEGEFYEKFLAKVESADKLCNFVTRTLEYFNFCV